MKSPLQPRKQILEQLGFESHASRSSWSHDLTDSIVFDSWEDQWVRTSGDKFDRYPLRTHGDGYSLEESRNNPRHGHTRWQRHVDLVLSGKRQPRAIVPVARDPKDHTKGAKGWSPLVIDGLVDTDENGDIWFKARRVTELPGGA